ncbi:tRNA (guanosine(37)-N1)-methyltransferase TrmD [Alkaliphilus peptidifermentans]|uniref:tRNA (guanine-N(1)-)-methyltransferase n=1 Tax=Alkaliphilus peptidifermentans DSM 18978 TaxID=1120976 RepID=A0A1G5J931_9FIRM|nr:tRNA (guanosine(37)-N1)-methyltransferase TrmD [Alkaliphilus peptidifermentans]SCY84684.1 tRNA (Guanine37-N(1)-) methyltransferase [Alkaliphilus peptidifermentans DSM 18978]
MIVRVLTLFPEMFKNTLGTSILQRAREKALLDIECINIRDYTDNKHKKVDDYPYGGGAGMVMTPQPIFDSYKAVINSLGSAINPKTIYMSPKGKPFNQQAAEALAKEDCLIFICGHYEGIDQRAIDYLVTDEISIGDYVLTGGEIPAMVVIDAVARLIPGVLSQEESYQEESFYSGLLEYPHYTRPRDFRGMEVPEVLTSGDHKKIDNWRRRKSLEITFKKRPDLLKNTKLTAKEVKIIQELKDSL